MRHDLERLISEHDGLCRLAENLVGAVNAPSCDIPDIVNARSQLAIALDEHLSKEDGFLYEWSLRETEADFASALEKFESDFASLRDDWGTYLAEWNGDVIAHDLDHFRDATSQIIARLMERIHHENTMLYPLALQQGRIKLRAA
jgi:iron-sulfur cluster repair protein YtfE (RIC family)